MRARPLGALLLGVMGAISAAPASAEESRGGSVRVSTDRLELVIAHDGGNPVGWRACHPSCARADAGSGTFVRFVSEGDPPALQLILRDHEPPLDLKRLPFVAELGENARARTATFQ